MSMEQYLKSWKKYINGGRILKEMRYIERMFLPDEFLSSLPPRVLEKINEYDVLDFAFEEYKAVFPQFNLGGVNPIKFFVPFGNKELFFDYSEEDEHRIIRVPTKEEILLRNKTIPVLPVDWYNAFLKHYKIPLQEKKIKRQLSTAKILAVFDFDDTLFKSTEVGDRMERESLGDSFTIPENPQYSDWNLDIVLRAQQLCANKNVYCVMMTGRVGEHYGQVINKILRDKNIMFAETHFKALNDDTAQFKINKVYEILDSMPYVEKIRMWDDDMAKIELYKKEFEHQIDLKIFPVQ